MTLLYLPVSGRLWQEIALRCQQEGVGVAEWVTRAVVEQCDFEPSDRERLLTDMLARADADVHVDLPPAWLAGGVGMLPVEMSAPRPVGVSLKNYRRLGGEPGGFRASLYLDGKRIGTVSNDGTSASNSYQFLDSAKGDEFFARARAWGESKGIAGHPDVELLDPLCLEREDLAEARAMLRAGAAAVIVVESHPHWEPENTSTEPNWYEEHSVVWVHPGEELEEVAVENRCARWRLIAAADAAEHLGAWRPRPRRRHGAGPEPEQRAPK